MTPDGHGWTAADIRATVTVLVGHDGPDRTAVLTRFASDGTFEQFVTAASTLPGEPRLWALVIGWIRRLRTESDTLAGGALGADRAAAAADGLYRALDGRGDLDKAATALARLLDVIAALHPANAADVIADRDLLRADLAALADNAP